jgi:hypothetical protein
MGFDADKIARMCWSNSEGIHCDLQNITFKCEFENNSSVKESLTRPPSNDNATDRRKEWEPVVMPT